MPQISITANAPIVRQGLENLDKEIPDIGRRRIYNTMLKIKARLRKYPPAPQNSTYVRTFRLRDAVEIVRADTGYKIQVDPVSPRGVRYGKYPLGSAYGTDQAWMHVGRWPLLRDVVDEELEMLPDEIEQEIEIVARRENL